MKRVAIFFTCFLVILFSTGSFVVKCHAQDKPLVVILIGPPGAGKGVQAENITTHFHIPSISTGGLFRENIKEKTPLGLQVKSYIDQGQLVPDELVLKMLFERISQKDAAHGYILDGFPRTLNQAIAFQDYIKDSARVEVIFLNVSMQTVFDRIENRRHGRSDDTVEVAKERYELYLKETYPVVQFYKDRPNFYEVSTEGPVEPIKNRVLEILSEETEPKVQLTSPT